MNLVKKFHWRFFPVRERTLNEVEDAIRRCRARNAVKTWIRVSADLNVILPQTEMRPLDLALESFNTRVLKWLLLKGVNADSRMKNGHLPLYFTCDRGYLDGVKLLVTHAAAIDFRSRDGLTCLHVATKNDHFEVVSFLLEQTSHLAKTTSIRRHCKLITIEDLDAKTEAGETAVFFAAKNNSLRCLEALLKAGADPNIGIQDNDGSLSSLGYLDGHCPLHEAVSQGDVETVELLVKYKANVEAVRSDGLSSIDIALALTPLKADVVNSLLKSSTVSEQVKRLASRCLKAEIAAGNCQPYEDDFVCCPITLEVIRDPVIAADGHTYERQAIEEWFRKTKNSPVTGQPMNIQTLIPNLAIKQMIALAQLQ